MKNRDENGLFKRINIITIQYIWRKEDGDIRMYTPTFYFLKNNHPDNELQELKEEFEGCGARVVILETGKEEKKLADSFLDVVKNHI